MFSTVNPNTISPEVTRIIAKALVRSISWIDSLPAPKGTYQKSAMLRDEARDLSSLLLLLVPKLDDLVQLASEVEPEVWPDAYQHPLSSVVRPDVFRVDEVSSYPDASGKDCNEDDDWQDWGARQGNEQQSDAYLAKMQIARVMLAERRKRDRQRARAAQKDAANTGDRLSMSALPA